MAQSVLPSSKLPYLTPDHKVERGSEHVQSPNQESLFDRVKENLDLTKHSGLTSSQSATAADAAENSSPQTPLTTRLWQGANALKETMTGTTSTESSGDEIHNSIPDDLLILGVGKYLSKEDIDQKHSVNGGVPSRSSSDESQSQEINEGNGKTWGQWVAEKAVAAEHVAAQSAGMVKDSAVSTVKYVAEAAASKLPNSAESPTDVDVKNHDMAGRGKNSAAQTLVYSGSGLKDTIAKKLVFPIDNQSSESYFNSTKFVQDVVNRYSTTTRTPEAGKKSTLSPRATSIQERTRNMAGSFKESAASALTPGDGERELAKTITESLSSLPTLLKEKVWNSSSSLEQSFNVLPPSTDSDFYPDNSTTTVGPGGGLLNRVVEVASSATGIISSDSPANLQDAEHENVEPRSETTSSTKVTGEEELAPVTPEKLMGLWTIASGNMDSAVNGELDSESFLAPESPKAPSSAPAAMKQINLKAEAIAEAHRSRVVLEASAYLEAEARKAEAHAKKMHTNIDIEKLQVEAKAMENLKKDELRAELVVHNAEVKAEKLLADAFSTSASIRATAEEEYARSMAEAKTKTERWLAEIDETKQREIAELHEKVEEMILTKEFPLATPKNRGVVKKVKEKVMSHLRGY